ncbi:MAG: Na+/H+ antiporter NhaC family protein [Candidatus Sumerlaeia bacterium]|nr:Na+/H+ antiporter NhaC family protein [Candidatus Sumerlaeia bacterium]
MAKQRGSGWIGFVVLTASVLWVAGGMAAPAAGAEGSAESVSAQMPPALGLWTLLPPLVAIVLSFITRNVVLSLFLGIFTATLLMSFGQGNLAAAPFHAFLGIVRLMVAALADASHAGILGQTLLIGGLIALVSRLGGARAVAEWLARRARGPRSAQIATWLMGLFVFFDDYANSLIIGPIMRPVTDRLRISREKLAFIIDATAAPVAGIALISTWIGFEVGVIKDALASVEPTANAYGLFVQTIPFRFYNILILAFVFFSAWSLRDFGSMLRAERRARTTGKVIADGAKPMVSAEATGLEPAPTAPLSLWNAVLPIGTLLVSALLLFYYNGYAAIIGGVDSALAAQVRSRPFSFAAVREAFSASDAGIVLFQAALLACMVAIALGVAKRIFTFGEAMDVLLMGMKALLITCVILVLAWSLSAAVRELGTAPFIISNISGALPAWALPALIFSLGSAISFATGTSYGTMAILMPLAVPLAHSISGDSGFMVMCVGAVLTGAIFGDHCSPISDTTILSSMGSACDLMDHVKTQLAYALVVAATSLVLGYLPVGLGVPVWPALLAGLAATAAMVRFWGKRADSTNVPERP